MTQSLVRLLIIFAATLLIMYGLQSWAVQQFSFQSNSKVLNVSYIFNALSALVLILGIFLAKHRFKDQLGFIFLIGSFAKLGIFIAVTHWLTIHINRTVFLDFFIAYVACMIFEVYTVSKILKSIN